MNEELKLEVEKHEEIEKILRQERLEIESEKVELESH